MESCRSDARTRTGEDLDRSDTATNVDAESCCSLLSGAASAQGDDEENPCDHDNDTRPFGHPPVEDEHQVFTSPAADIPDSRFPQWTHDYNRRVENGNLGWAFANGGARAKNKAKQI